MQADISRRGANPYLAVGEDLQQKESGVVERLSIKWKEEEHEIENLYCGASVGLWRCSPVPPYLNPLIRSGQCDSKRCPRSIGLQLVRAV